MRDLHPCRAAVESRRSPCRVWPPQPDIPLRQLPVVNGRIVVPSVAIIANLAGRRCCRSVVTPGRRPPSHAIGRAGKKGPERRPPGEGSRAAETEGD